MSATNEDEIVLGVFLDLSKAFDTELLIKSQSMCFIF